LIRLEAFQSQFTVHAPKYFFDLPEQLGTESLAVEGLIDHHEIDPVSPVDRIANDLAIANEHPAAIKVFLDIAICSPAVEKPINRLITEEGAITCADRLTGKLDQGSCVRCQCCTDGN